ncbi:hypothetical protein [Chlorogloeopsis sp. ULAP02]|uniref:hypothetical protein n=1 Tax=Chlorogloeopsis sp. ULAP02 TaxID=3107926 RepID=UPI003136159B
MGTRGQGDTEIQKQGHGARGIEKIQSPASSSSPYQVEPGKEDLWAAASKLVLLQIVITIKKLTVKLLGVDDCFER